MTPDLFEEKKRLTEIISSIDYVDKFDNLKVIGMEGKEVVGFMSGNTDGSFLNKHYVYQTIYKSIKHVDFYVKKSLYDALGMIYAQDYKDFSMLFQSANEFEVGAIYYVENAVFRTIILWDFLAQLYNEYFDVGLKRKNVSYKRLFKSQKNEELSNRIHTYLEIDNGEMKGHHKFVSEYRNKMTHRNSPNITTLSSYDFNLNLPMLSVNYHVIKDYENVSLFIKELLDIIEGDYLE